MFSGADIFTDDLRKAYVVANPTVIPENDLVVILLDEASDAEIKTVAFDNAEKIIVGIDLARQVNAERARKTTEALLPADFVIPIFCSGPSSLFRQLETFLQNEREFYPPNLIAFHPYYSTHLLTQIHSCKNFLAVTLYKNIIVVSSSHQLARIARMLGQDAPLARRSRLGKVRIFLHGTEKNLHSPEVSPLLEKEHALLTFSTEKTKYLPTLMRLTSRNIFFNDTDVALIKSFNLQLIFPQAFLLTQTLANPRWSYN